MAPQYTPANFEHVLRHAYTTANQGTVHLMPDVACPYSDPCFRSVWIWAYDYAVHVQSCIGIYKRRADTYKRLAEEKDASTTINLGKA